MPEDIALLHLHHGPVQQVQVAAAERAAGDFEDDVAGLDELGAGGFDDLDLVLGLPHQRLHGVGLVTGRFVVGHVLLRDGAAVVADGLFDLVGCLGDGHGESGWQCTVVMKGVCAFGTRGVNEARDIKRL